MTATHALYAKVARGLKPGNEHWFMNHLSLAERARAAAFAEIDSPLHSIWRKYTALRVRSVESFRTILSAIASLRLAAPEQDRGIGVARRLSRTSESAERGSLNSFARWSPSLRGKAEK